MERVIHQDKQQDASAKQGMKWNGGMERGQTEPKNKKHTIPPRLMMKSNHITSRDIYTYSHVLRTSRGRHRFLPVASQTRSHCLNHFDRCNFTQP